MFDKLALIRTTVMMRQVYGELIGQFTRNPSLAATDASLLPLYELGFHLRQVLRPLLAWAADPHTATYLATKHKLSEVEARRALEEVSAAWQQQADEVWCGPPVPGHPPTVQANLALHLMCTARSIAEILGRMGDPRWPHRDLLLLFLGHYFANAPIQRLWASGDKPAEIDPVGRWFWGAWMRVIDNGHEMDSSTWTGPPPRL